MNVIPEKIAYAIISIFSADFPVPVSLFQRDPDEGTYSLVTSSTVNPICKYMHDTGYGHNCKLDYAKLLRRFGHGNEKTLCHMGLYNWTSSIYVNNNLVGILLCGQERVNDSEDNGIASKIFERSLSSLGMPAGNREQLRALFNKHTTASIDASYLENISIIGNWLYGIIYERMKLEKTIELVAIEKKELGETAETIAHEIQIQLQGLTADCENIIRYEIPHSELGLKKVINDLLNSIKRTNVTVSSIYESLHYNFVLCNVGEILRSSIEMYAALAAQKGVEIVLRNHGLSDFPKIELSKDHIILAINNLIHNAIKYSYRGTSRKRVKRYVEVSGEPEGDYYSITVSNYGIGILPTEYDTIFERGYKGILSRDEGRTGGGFGLPTVKKIIEAHGGQISIQSQPIGQAEQPPVYLTEFRVILPFNQLKRVR
jgi:signal transduction histidine kinase